MDYLIEFYRLKVTFKAITGERHVLWPAFGLAAAAIIFFVLYLAENRWINLCGTIGAIGFLILYGIWITMRDNRVLQRLDMAPSSRFDLKRLKFRTRQIVLIKEFLMARSWNSRQQVTEVIGLLSSEIDRRTFKDLAPPTIFGVFLFPAWQRLINKAFDQMVSQAQAIHLFITTLGLFLALLLLYYQWKYIVKDMFESNTSDLRHLRSLLQDILLDVVD
jgi:hypothetical protein